ncbi:MAG: SDR family oxidoreductase, partial [Acidobacteria bacterium]|nr:SDR family oxidoreductase [Acidobacteriota bacterium]
MTEAIPDEMKTKFARRRVPLRRYGDPEELAHAIVNLSLPSSSYVTGHAFVVDGGMTIKNN